jgi:hypothetical protein
MTGNPGGATGPSSAEPNIPCCSTASQKRRWTQSSKWGAGKADIQAAIPRHQAGDCGDVPEEDRQQNELSPQQGFRLLATYWSAQGVKLWIITEADRSSRTALQSENH